MNYYDYIDSYEWQIKRDERLKVDNYTCTRCGATDNLQVHHRTYGNLGNEPMDELITFCSDCHKWEHDRKLPKLKELRDAMRGKLNQLRHDISNIASEYCAQYGYNWYGKRVTHIEEYNELEAIVNEEIIMTLKQYDQHIIDFMDGKFCWCNKTKEFFLPIRLEKVRDMLDRDIPVQEIAAVIHEKPASVYRIIKQIKEEQQ